MRFAKSCLFALSATLLFSLMFPSTVRTEEGNLSEGEFLYVRRYLNQRPLPGAKPIELVSFRCSVDGVITIKIDSKTYETKRGEPKLENFWIVTTRVIDSSRKSFAQWLGTKKERSENRIYLEMAGSGLDTAPHVEERIVSKNDGTEYELRLINYLSPGLPNVNTGGEGRDYLLLFGILSSVDAIALVLSRDVHAVQYPARQGLYDQLEMLLPIK